MGTGPRWDAAGAAGRRRAFRAADLAARVHGGAGMAVTDDYLGAHVSTDGGVATAPPRAREIGASALQLFTKTPNQWREPVHAADEVARFRTALARAGIRPETVVAHDSYLINLASPDPRLRARSIRSFIAELVRCGALGIPWVVSHPGNYIDDRAAGLDRNARGYAECLAAVPGEVGVLIEGTAGAGTALGATFEELRALRDALPVAARARVGFCLDTAHLHAAGYDVAGDPEGVWERLDREVGLALLKCLHLNDSKAAPGSRLDRHEWIGEGTIGAELFRRLMRDPRFRRVIKIIETPKGDEPVRHDRRMLRRLRAYARGARPETPTMELACERFSAPAHVESLHSSGCLVLHDELRCALCHFAGAPLALLVVRHAAPDFTLVERRPGAADPAPRSRPAHLSAPPRAPPVTVS